jgi:hypothetical protein
MKDESLHLSYGSMQRVGGKDMGNGMKVIFLFWVGLLLSGCSRAGLVAVTPTTVSTPEGPSAHSTPDPYFQSDGGGEPRSAGYWLLWNGCVEGNKADVAAANGGRSAG